MWGKRQEERGTEEGGDRRRRGGTEWEEKGKERKGESRPPHGHL